MADAAPLLQHTLRFRVRTYEVDENGHVNNAVYLQWAENLTAEHVEAHGFGRRWSIDRGGAWLVRRHEITYRRPAFRGEEVIGTVRVLSLDRVRGVRRTSFRRASDGVVLAEVRSEWVWVRLSDGRPSRVPQELLDAWGPALAGDSHAG
ncbi:MAG TPA: thioesterase family protein [Methylomirabilota bacterium]